MGQERRTSAPTVVMVAGPTASGKSALARALAEAFDGVVVNADSMQIYRELRVLTARPGPTETGRVPHRLYGVLSGAERCSVGRWRGMALAEIAACHAAGRLPLLVGGTGLYLRALERGLAPVPEVPAVVRAAAAALHRGIGGAAFHRRLAARDPAVAARLGPSDTQRLIRAWEVLEATGRSLAEWQAEGRAADRGDAAPGYRFLRIVCLPPRPALYAACDARFLRMIERGALAEVRALLRLDLDPALPVMKALGVRELARHLAGTVDLDTAVAAAQQATRNYAKRQTTWLRTQVLAVDPEAILLDEQYSESLGARIFPKIRRFLLTG